MMMTALIVHLTNNYTSAYNFIHLYLHKFSIPILTELWVSTGKYKVRVLKYSANTIKGCAYKTGAIFSADLNIC